MLVSRAVLLTVLVVVRIGLEDVEGAADAVGESGIEVDGTGFEGIPDGGT